MIRAMLSEWLKIMLEEIARKNAAAQQALIEEQRRGQPVFAPDRATG